MHDIDHITTELRIVCINSMLIADECALNVALAIRTQNVPWIKSESVFKPSVSCTQI